MSWHPNLRRQLPPRRPVVVASEVAAGVGMSPRGAVMLRPPVSSRAQQPSARLAKTASQRARKRLP